MKIFFSPASGGFYNDELHGDARPGDAVEITEEEHAALLNGQSRGQRVAPGPDGKPTLQAHPPWTAEQVRARRDAAIIASDWTQAPGARSRIGETMAAAWDAYRQALFDLPAQPGFPATVTWPDPPL